MSYLLEEPLQLEKLLSRCVSVLALSDTPKLLKDRCCEAME